MGAMMVAPNLDPFDLICGKDYHPGWLHLERMPETWERGHLALEIPEGGTPSLLFYIAAI